MEVTPKGAVDGVREDDEVDADKGKLGEEEERETLAGEQKGKEQEKEGTGGKAGRGRQKKK